MRLREAFEPPVPAIVLAEGAFGEIEGKTANGVVLHGDLFEPRAVIDSSQVGESPATVLGRPDAPEVPIVADIDAALEVAPGARALILGVAPAGGDLPHDWEPVIERAMRAGCDIVSGLHVFLSDRERWTSLATETGTRLFDVRKPPEPEELRVADGRVDDLDAAVVLTAGTDCGVGKRTTTVELYEAALDQGLDVGWVATGQTGLMTGAHAGHVIDRIPADFAAGAVEDSVVSVGTAHDLVFVEGQASLLHRAYSGVTLAILHGAWPDAVVLADDPTRERRTHFEQFPVRGLAAERELIESSTDAVVAAVSTWGDPDRVALDIPAANIAHEDGAERLLEAVTASLDDSGFGELVTT